MKKSVEVSMMGQKFMVRSESEEDYIQQISSFVDKKIDEIQQNTKSVSSVHVALLAAMNIADEYFKFKNGRQGAVERVEKKIKDMIELIELQL